MLARLGLVLGLSKHLAVEGDLGVAADHQRPRARRGGDRRGLPARVDKHELAGLPLGELLDLRLGDVELHAERLEQRAALRRA